jgi:hypothetical protein
LQSRNAVTGVEALFHAYILNIFVDANLALSSTPITLSAELRGGA